MTGSVALPQRSYDGWSGVAWRCAAYFPGITLATLSLLNVLLKHTGSSGAIPLTAFFSLLSLWFIISIPLCFSGAPPRPAPCATFCACPTTRSQAVLSCTGHQARCRSVPRLCGACLVTGSAVCSVPAALPSGAPFVGVGGSLP